jgi:hypothetical protein
VFWHSHTPDLIHPRPQRLTYSTISNSEPPFDYLQLHVGQSPRYMESCPRFEYLFLATYLSLPTTRPFLGPAVYAPTRRTTLSLASPTRISPPSVSPVPTRYPAPSAGNIYLFLSSPLSLFPSKDKPAAVSFSLPTSPHNPTNIWPIGVIAICPL